jgi:hypothetical protein
LIRELTRTNFVLIAVMELTENAQLADSHQFCLDRSDGNGMIPIHEFQMALLQLNVGMNLAGTKVIFEHYSTGRGSPGKKQEAQGGPKLLNWRYFTGRMEAVKKERDERHAGRASSKRKSGEAGFGGIVGGGGRTKRSTLVSQFPNLASGASTARGPADDQSAAGLLASTIKF